MSDLTESFTWRHMVPVVLQFFASHGTGTNADASVAVQEVADRDYPSQANRKLQNSTAVDDRTHWALWHAKDIGFLESVERGVYRITDMGTEWLALNQYPLNDDQRKELGVLAKLARAKARAEKANDNNEESPREGSDYFWILRAGKSGEQEAAALKQNLGIPGLDFGPTGNKANTKEEIQEGILHDNPEMAPNAASNFAGQLSRFKNDMQVGDLVAMPSKLSPGVIYLGHVAGEYEFHPEAPENFRHVRPINWQSTPIRRTELGIDLQRSFNSLLTICQVSRNNAFERIESVVQGEGDPGFGEPEHIVVREPGWVPNFDWAPFYSELARKLLKYKDDRTGLLAQLRVAAEASERPSLFKHLWKWHLPEGPELATDIDPFVILGTFNRKVTDSNRKAICAGFKEAFNVEAPIPTDFSAVPTVNNLKSRYEASEADPGNAAFYDGIWELLDSAIRYADAPTPQTKQAFSQAFDAATEGRSPVMYTMALFWALPEQFLALDNANVSYLEQESVLGYKINKVKLTAQDYFSVLDDVRAWMADPATEPKSLKELSHEAYLLGRADVAEPAQAVAREAQSGSTEFTIDKLIEKGCFVPRKDIELMLTRLKEKRNLILQGPPGTGKTWIARELAKILCGEDSDENITAVQFHPSMSYEDFVQGFRPGGDGRLVLARGPFLNAVDKAMESSKPHIVVIEEINRGNPAQIFGEMLTLLEADKRSPDHALTLLYGDDDDPVYLPENLYVIGTMNQADRSLAMVDMALRRRFAFVNLRPQLAQPWRDFCATQRNIDPALLEDIAARINQVNQLIAEDFTLGSAYLIGHSYVTPTKHLASASDTRAWFTRVIDSDLAPLLEEYWFDNPAKLREALNVLRG